MIEFKANVMRYDGNDATTSFDYTYPIFADSDLLVYVDGVLQTLSSDYTVTGVGLPGGGTVEFSVAPPTGTTNIILERSVPYTQTIAIPEGSKFPARLVETGLDRIVVMLHQLFDKAIRGITIASYAATGDEDLEIAQNAAQRADRVVSFSPDGNTVTVGPTVTELQSLIESSPSAIINATASTLRGRGSAAGNGPVEAITLGAGLAMNGTVLEAEAGGQPNVDVHDRFEGYTVGLKLDAGPIIDISNPDQARLTDCQYLVTDKGTIVTPSKGLLADFATVGAGGRDRADDGTSGHRWWEVYYIYKSTEADPGSPAEDALLFSPAQSRVQTAAFVAGLDSAHILRLSSANQQAAQSFTTTVALAELHSVVVSMAKVSTPSGNLWLEIHADSSGAPSGTALATSETKQVSRLLTAYQWQGFHFRGANRIALADATTYWIVAKGDFSIDGVNYVIWSRVTAGGYTGGTALLYDGATWSGTGADARFSVQGIPVDTTVTMPTGYDEKCLLGYAQTIANGAEFVSCSGKDREYIDRSAVSGSARVMANPTTVTADWFSSCYNATTSTIGNIPYRENMVETLRAWGTSASLSFGFGGERASDMPAAIPVTYVEDSFYVGSPAAPVPTSPIEIPVGRSSGVYLTVTAATGSVLSRAGFKW